MDGGSAARPTWSVMSLMSCSPRPDGNERAPSSASRQGVGQPCPTCDAITQISVHHGYAI